MRYMHITKRSKNWDAKRLTFAQFLRYDLPMVHQYPMIDTRMAAAKSAPAIRVALMLPDGQFCPTKLGLRTMTRQSVCTKVVDLEAKSVTLQFHDFPADGKPGDGTNVVFVYGKASPEIQARLMAHGTSQKLGDSFAGVKGDIDKGIENAQTVVERLQSGEWVRARESAGPRPSMVVDAVIAALIDDGQTVDDERRASITAKVRTSEGRETAMRNPAIKAQYETLRANAAAERAKAAKARAKTAAKDEPEANALSDF